MAEGDNGFENDAAFQETYKAASENAAVVLKMLELLCPGPREGGLALGMAYAALTVGYAKDGLTTKEAEEKGLEVMRICLKIVGDQKDKLAA